MLAFITSTTEAGIELLIDEIGGIASVGGLDPIIFGEHVGTPGGNFGISVHVRLLQMEFLAAQVQDYATITLRTGDPDTGTEYTFQT
jgi:hypothetical protein